MRLHVEEQGSGDHVVVLLHGMMGSAESWWRVAGRLADGGYRVLALDLPGHGLSPRDPFLTVQRAADAVVESVRALSPASPAVAMGHSFGGVVLAAAAPSLEPRLAVYVDAPIATRGGHDRDAIAAEYERDRRLRTTAMLRTTRPEYGDRDRLVEATAAERFDPRTAAAVASAAGGDWTPAAGSLVLRTEPSRYLTDADAGRLQARGVVVRGVPGAAHSIWYSHFDEFVAALPEVFGSS